MKNKIFFFILCAIHFTAVSQDFNQKMNEIHKEKNRVIDSLKLVLEDTSEKDIVLMAIVKEYMSIDQDSIALTYVNQLLKDEANNDVNKMAEYRLMKADLLFRLKHSEEAVLMLNKNLDEDLSAEKKVDTYKSLSEYYQSIGEFEKSLELTKKNERFYLKENDSIGLFSVYCSIAIVYTNLNRKKDAIEYFKKASSIGKNEKPYNKVAILINLSILLNDVEEYSPAIKYMNQAKEIALEYNIYEIFPIIYKSLGIIYHQKDEYKKSNEYCLKSLDLAKKSNLPEGQLISLYNYLGVNYYHLSNYSKAIFYLKKADDLDENDMLIREWDAEITEHPLINSYLKIGDNQNAFETLKKYTKIKTTFFEKEQASKLNAAVEKYENDKKEIEIKQLSIENASQESKLEAQRRIIFLGVVLLVILLLFGFALYKNYENKRKLKRTKQSLNNSILKQRFLRMQLNPHFLFHSLCSIESYIYQEKKEAAAEFLQDFSRLMRSILESSDIDFISLNDEVSFIEKYMKLQQLAYNDKFDYSINIDDQIDKEKSLVPPIFIQPFIENAILHGALSMDKGFVSIEVTKDSEHLVVSISDNGESTNEVNMNSKKMFRSMSMNIIQQRIENLKSIFNYHISYSLKNRREFSESYGTLITLSFPLIHGNITATSLNS